MPRLEISARKFLDFDTTISSNIILKKQEAPNLGIRLCPEQAYQLWISLDTIDAEAETFWQTVGTDVPFSHHLGWRVFLTVKKYEGNTYYDIRRWWKIPLTGDRTPTKIGLCLNTAERDTLKQYRTIVAGSIPAIDAVQPCTCWTRQEYEQCNRCVAFNDS